MFVVKKLLLEIVVNAKQDLAHGFLLEALTIVATVAQRSYGDEASVHTKRLCSSEELSKLDS